MWTGSTTGKSSLWKEGDVECLGRLSHRCKISPTPSSCSSLVVAGDGKGLWQNLKCITSFLLHEFGPNCNDFLRAQRDTILSAPYQCPLDPFMELDLLAPVH